MNRTTYILIAVLLACCARAQFGALPVVQVQSRWTPIRLGPVAWYAAEDNALDSAGTNNAAWTGAAAYTNGVAGQAFRFSLNRVDTTAIIPRAGDFSVFAWARIRTHVSSYLVNQTDLTGEGRVLFFNGAGFLRVQFGATTRDLTVDAGEWVLMGLTRSDGTAQAWYNGEASGASFSNDNTLPDRTVQIGGTDRTSNRNSESDIDDVLLFNRALAATEVKRLYDESILQRDRGQAWRTSK